MFFFALLLKVLCPSGQIQCVVWGEGGGSPISSPTEPLSHPLIGRGSRVARPTNNHPPPPITTTNTATNTRPTLTIFTKWSGMKRKIIFWCSFKRSDKSFRMKAIKNKKRKCTTCNTVECIYYEKHATEKHAGEHILYCRIRTPCNRIYKFSITYKEIYFIDSHSM